MSTFQIFKETALPGTLAANAIYLVTSNNSNYVEVYVTNSAGSASRRVPTVEDIDALITAAISGINAIEVVSTISARNSLNPDSNTQVLVLDASADSSVTSGAATYVWDQSNTSWVKISEAESLDVVVNWANIQGKPSSSSSAIDTAVNNAHTHANKSQLDKVGQDAEGFGTYDGTSLVVTKNLSW